MGERELFNSICIRGCFLIFKLVPARVLLFIEFQGKMKMRVESSGQWVIVFQDCLYTPRPFLSLLLSFVQSPQFQRFLLPFSNPTLSFSLSLTPGRLQRNLFSSKSWRKCFLETTEPCTDIIVCKNLKECSNMCDYIYILMILMRFWVGLVLMTHTRCVTTSGAYLISFVWPPLAKSAAHYQIKDVRLKWQITMFSCSTWSPSASWREPPMPRPWSYL